MNHDEFARELKVIQQAAERQRLHEQRRMDKPHTERMSRVREQAHIVCALREHGDLISADILAFADDHPGFDADHVAGLADELTAKYSKAAALASAEATRREPLLPAIPDCADEELPDAFGVELHDEQDFTGVKPMDIQP